MKQIEQPAALAEQPAPMSQPNRLIAYSATSKLRELGYEWADDAWKQSAEQEPVKFLANGTRFKMSFFQNEDGEGNTVPGTHVTCFEAFEEDLDGRWVALVPAEDDCHLKYTAPQPRKQPLTREEIFEIAEPFGEFQYGDAQGHKRIDFANAIIAAYERKNGVQT